MAGKVINKMMGFLGLEDEYNEEIEETEETENADETDKETFISQKNNKNQSKVVSIHTSNSTKVLIIKPETFDEAMNLCDEIKNRKIVVVNLTKMEKNISQRFLDFMAGGSYALSGQLEEVEKGIYIISPSNVAVTNELKSELSSKGIFDWSK